MLATLNGHTIVCGTARLDYVVNGHNYCLAELVAKTPSGREVVVVRENVLLVTHVHHSEEGETRETYSLSKGGGKTYLRLRAIVAAMNA